MDMRGTKTLALERKQGVQLKR